MTTYDRQLLLFGPKRNEVLELWEVLRFGADTFGDDNYLSIYDMKPGEWYARGIRLLGRTAIECTPDHVADAIGRDIAETVDAIVNVGNVMVVDPFAGSANTLYWILRRLPGAHGIGFESDPQVYQLTQQNLTILGSPMQFARGDYLDALSGVKVQDNQLVVTFIAPPWGDAFSQSNGLDLRGTAPPVQQIVDAVAMLFPNPMLFAIQVVQHMVADSLKELKTRFDWSALHIYDSNKAGQNRNALLLATFRLPRKNLPGRK